MGLLQGQSKLRRRAECMPESDGHQRRNGQLLVQDFRNGVERHVDMVGELRGAHFQCTKLTAQYPLGMQGGRLLTAGYDIISPCPAPVSSPARRDTAQAGVAAGRRENAASTRPLTLPIIATPASRRSRNASVSASSSEESRSQYSRVAP